MTATVRHTFSTDNLAHMTLEQVENHYHQGLVTQDEYEAYRHVWATSPAHAGYVHSYGWGDGNFPAEVLELADEIRAAAGIH